jgi:hypothetical protein
MMIRLRSLHQVDFEKTNPEERETERKTAFCLVFLLVCSEGHSISTDATTTTHSVTLFECLNFFFYKNKAKEEENRKHLLQVCADDATQRLNLHDFVYFAHP